MYEAEKTVQGSKLEGAKSDSNDLYPMTAAWLGNVLLCLIHKFQFVCVRFFLFCSASSIPTNGIRAGDQGRVESAEKDGARIC